jgi:hypothetical protein
MDADVPSTDDGAAVTHAEAGVAGDVAASPVVAFEKVSDDASAEGTPLSDAPASTAAERLAREPAEADDDPTAEIIHAEDAEDAPVAAREPTSGSLATAADRENQNPAKVAGKPAPAKKSSPEAPARPASAAPAPGKKTLNAAKAAWNPNGPNTRPGSVPRPSTSRTSRDGGESKRRSRFPWNDPPPDAPPGVRPFYEHLAPSRWRDARLPEARRDAQSARLFADAVRRRETKRAVADAPVPRTRWSGRLPASRLDAGFSRIAGDAAAFVENRAAIAVPDRPQTGIMRYTGSHDEFRGELEPAPVVPEKERVANLVKQFYGETAKRAVHRAERYELYLSTLRPVSARERELLKMDDVPVIPIQSDFDDIAEKELDAAQALKTNARAKSRTERLASAAAARAYKEARAQSEEARTLAMRVRLRSAREERAVAERKAAEIREAKALAKTKEAEALEKEAEAQKAEMHAKFAALAAARRAEIAAGDAKRAGLEAERAVLKRKEMKALWEKQKAREAKYAEMMSAENDAGTALVEETRAHRRSADEARKADRERRAAAKKEERKANREKARAYQETVAQMEARQKEKQATIKKELRMRAAALEAEAKKRREASEEARRAERRARGEVTPPKKKKKRRPRGSGASSPPGSGAKAGSNAVGVGDENAAPSPNASVPAPGSKR